MTVINDAERAAALPAASFGRPDLRRIFGPLAGLAWIAVAFATLTWRDNVDSDWAYTAQTAYVFAAVGVVLTFVTVAGGQSVVSRKAQHLAPWLFVLALFFGAWEVATAKLVLWPMPFFPPPQALVEVVIDDWKRLADSTAASLWLLGRGYFIGAAVGFCVGVGVGWSVRIGYWVHPILRFVGPLPATAWLPLAFFVFPSSASASTFLVALATGFPVTVLTWSGIASVRSDYYDIARTLGANTRFLVLKVAIPAALPHVFVGLFMGLGNSFAVLVVAEMLGVKSGLGWYLQWAQGWAAYANMYAALLLTAVICSSLITLLFKLRDRLLSWQKGLVKW
jgi:NitT/TauT family transport system permease protein